MIRILLLLTFVYSLHAGTRPYVELDGEPHTVASVNSKGEAVLADGRLVKLSRGQVPLLMEVDDDYSVSSVEATLSTGPQLALVDSPWGVHYQFAGELSETVDSFAVLIRTDEAGEKVTVPFKLVLEESGVVGRFEVSIEPFGTWKDVLKSDPSQYFYECRLFADGREILVERDGKSPLLVDWDRFESKEESKPEIILQVVDKTVQRKGVAQAVVEFVVDKNGETQSVRVLSKTKGWFAEPARRMIEMSRLYPIVKDGAPVAAKLKIPVMYSEN